MSKPLNPWKLSGYKPGQNVVCRIMNAEPGGYAVLIPKDNLPGFLPTQERLRLGDEVLATFVCVHNNRILLSARFSTSNQAVQGAPPAQTAVKWEEQLDSINQAPDPSAQAVPGPDADQAFSVWASQQPTRKFHLKRAIDLILPPIHVDSLNQFKIADYDLEWLITDLEGGMRTGCVKASSEDRLSRAAMLLYRGRAVGCIYGCKSMPDTLPTEQSLQTMLTDLSLPETKVMIYDLPENVTLAMSALFLGYPVTRSDDYDARSYMDYICSWFESKGQTACLAISLKQTAATCLVFIYKGQFCGAFYVEDQKFTQDKQFVYELLRNDPHSSVEASILPPEMTSSAVRFGFSLSMARKA